jgi:itaconate CoA-transferase
MTGNSAKDLEGLLVVTVEQAVAAPYASRPACGCGRAGDQGGAAEGDFARRYDRYVMGESAYFVWLNRGKESVALDLKRRGRPRAAAHRMIARPTSSSRTSPRVPPHGSASTAGRSRARHERLIACSISGYGETGPIATRRPTTSWSRPRAGWPGSTARPRGRPGWASRSATSRPG